MCSICHKSEHDIGCPHYVNNELDICAECGSYIHKGVKHVNLGGAKFHLDCVNNLDNIDILNLLKIKIHE